LKCRIIHDFHPDTQFRKGNMKLMNAKKKFEQNHPKFEAFLKAVFLNGNKIQEGTIIEITVIKPGEQPISANLKVQQSDLELMEELRNLGQ